MFVVMLSYTSFNELNLNCVCCSKTVVRIVNTLKNSKAKS